MSKKKSDKEIARLTAILNLVTAIVNLVFLLINLMIAIRAG